MEGFRSLKEGEAVEFTFKKSSKGLESIRVTGPGGVFCIGSERRPKGKNLQKRRSKGDRYQGCKDGGQVPCAGPSPRLCPQTGGRPEWGQRGAGLAAAVGGDGVESFSVDSALIC